MVPARKTNGHVKNDPETSIVFCNIYSIWTSDTSTNHNDKICFNNYLRIYYLQAFQISFQRKRLFHIQLKIWFTIHNWIANHLSIFVNLLMNLEHERCQTSVGSVHSWLLRLTIIKWYTKNFNNMINPMKNPDYVKKIMMPRFIHIKI